MKRAVVLKHVAFEGPGRIATLVTDLGYQLEIRELHAGDAVPMQLPREDLLIVMGGPMGVGDLDGNEFPFLHKERDLIAQRLEHDEPVLGVCLGAQLMASAAGARVEPMKRADGTRVLEVGWSPVRFHHEARTDVLAGMPESAPMLHWHGDAFDLPSGAQLLASTEVWRNQAFQLGQRAFGLQFHCEMTAESIETIVVADAPFAVRANGVGAEETIRRDTRELLPICERFGDRLLGNMLRAMAG